ncbi:MAG: hypothetical protein R3A11_07945 [Bdellovibrionota bacterium]
MTEIYAFSDRVRLLIYYIRARHYLYSQSRSDRDRRRFRVILANMLSSVHQIKKENIVDSFRSNLFEMGEAFAASDIYPQAALIREIQTEYHFGDAMRIPRYVLSEMSSGDIQKNYLDNHLHKLDLYRWLLSKERGNTWEESSRFIQDYGPYLQEKQFSPAVMQKNCSLQSYPNMNPRYVNHLNQDIESRQDWFEKSSSTLDRKEGENIHLAMDRQIQMLENDMIAVGSAYQAYKQSYLNGDEENQKNHLYDYQMAVFHVYENYQTKFITRSHVFQKWFGLIKTADQLRSYILEKVRPHPLIYDRHLSSSSHGPIEWSYREQMARNAGSFHVGLPEAGYHIHELKSSWEMQGDKIVHYKGIYWKALEETFHTLEKKCKSTFEDSKIYLNHIQQSLHLENLNYPGQENLYRVQRHTYDLHTSDYDQKLEDYAQTPVLMGQVLNDKLYYIHEVVAMVHNDSNQEQVDYLINQFVKGATLIGGALLLGFGLGFALLAYGPILISTIVGINYGMMVLGAFQLGRLFFQKYQYERRLEWIDGILAVGEGTELDKHLRAQIQKYLLLIWAYGSTLLMFQLFNAPTYFRWMIRFWKITLGPVKFYIQLPYLKDFYTKFPTLNFRPDRSPWFQSLTEDERAFAQAFSHLKNGHNQFRVLEADGEASFLQIMEHDLRNFLKEFGSKLGNDGVNLAQSVLNKIGHYRNFMRPGTYQGPPGGHPVDLSGPLYWQSSGNGNWGQVMPSVLIPRYDVVNGDVLAAETSPIVTAISNELSSITASTPSVAPALPTIGLPTPFWVSDLDPEEMKKFQELWTMLEEEAKKREAERTASSNWSMRTITEKLDQIIRKFREGKRLDKNETKFLLELLESCKETDDKYGPTLCFEAIAMAKEMISERPNGWTLFLVELEKIIENIDQETLRSYYQKAVQYQRAYEHPSFEGKDMTFSEKGIINRIKYFLSDEEFVDILDMYVFRFNDFWIRFLDSIPEVQLHTFEDPSMLNEFLIHLAISFSPEALNDEQIQEHISIGLDRFLPVVADINNFITEEEGEKLVVVMRRLVEYFKTDMDAMFYGLNQDIYYYHQFNILNEKELVKRNRVAFDHMKALRNQYRFKDEWHGILCDSLYNQWLAVQKFLKDKSQDEKIAEWVKRFQRDKSNALNTVLSSVWKKAKDISQQREYRDQDWTRVFEKFQSSRLFIEYFLSASIGDRAKTEASIYHKIKEIDDLIKKLGKQRGSYLKGGSLEDLIIPLFSIFDEFVQETWELRNYQPTMEDPITEDVMKAYRNIQNKKYVSISEMSIIVQALNKSYAVENSNSSVRQNLTRLYSMYQQRTLEENGYEVEEGLYENEKQRLIQYRATSGLKRTVEYREKVRDYLFVHLSQSGASNERWDDLLQALSTQGPISLVLSRNQALNWNHHLGAIHGSKCHHAHLTNVRGGNNLSIMWWENPENLDDLGHPIVEILWAGKSGDAPYRSSQGMKAYPCFGK